MFSKLLQLFRRRPPVPSQEENEAPDLPAEPAKVTDTEEYAWYFSPADPLDIPGWDKYWTEHLNHGIGPAWSDIFCRITELVQAMNEHGMRTVLCAGNGISQEPKALAAAGFQVVALDISPQAVEIARSFEFPDAAFGNYCDPALRRPGGSVEYAAGNLLDPAVFPGPFDVIIERRTAQVYLRHDLAAMMTAITSRLDKNGILVSHCHDGGWRPPARPRHHPKVWLDENKWAIWGGGPGPKPPGQVAWLITSTG